eukprot:273859-Pleurochrysis_carterae.AAC.3
MPTRLHRYFPQICCQRAAQASDTTTMSGNMAMERASSLASLVHHVALTYVRLCIRSTRRRWQQLRRDCLSQQYVSRGRVRGVRATTPACSAAADLASIAQDSRAGPSVSTTRLSEDGRQSSSKVVGVQASVLRQTARWARRAVRGRRDEALCRQCCTVSVAIRHSREDYAKPVAGRDWPI